MKKQFKLIKDKNSFQIHWDKKSINEKRDDDWNKYLEIEGYASTKDKDRGHDIVEPKAFENALATYMTNPVVLLQHKHDKPIGVVTEASIDNKGLYIKANITEDTDGVMSAIKNGVLRTFSIGYGLKEGDYEVEETVDENGKYDYTTTIKNLELYEISVVSVPMNAYALMKSIEDCFEVKEVEEDPVEDEEAIEGTSIDWEVNIEHWEEVIEEEPTEESEEKAEDEVKTDEIPEEETHTEEVVEDETEEVEEKEEEKAVDTVEENTENEEEVVEEENTKEDEKEEEIETEEKEVAENANIEETEVEEVPENEAETPTDDWKADETSSSEEVETKSIEGSSETKSFEVEEKAIEERLEKKFEAKLVENTKKVEDLTKELEQTKAVLKAAIGVLKEMDAAVRNTVIRTGATYSKVAKKKSAWWEVISQAQNSI